MAKMSHTQTFLTFKNKTAHMPENLEIVLKKKVRPILDQAMHRFIGITVDEINADISDKLLKNPLLDVELDTSLSLKKARDKFRRFYLLKLLQNNFGNISKVAEIADTDRRTIHRLTSALKINVSKIRKDMLKADYIKQEAVKDIIETTLDNYKSVIKEEKLEKLYKNVSTLSKNIIRELPDEPLTLKDAEREFERRFITKALKENNDSVTKTAKKLKIRYETLHRKLKSLDMT